MKVLDLKLRAFGPFLKEQHIDFTQLNDKGMFLINGPTGTGKTSLFDAIVFALYGTGSGKDRNDGKSLRSDFATDEQITYVYLKFEANGQIYEIYRYPAYNRKAKKGGGTTLEAAKAELHMQDGSVISKPKDVDNKIENEILFINRDQFKSVALLAQGEFTELITASSKDRAAILEHIFQKEIYDEFQRKITELSKKAEAELNAVISSVETLIKKVDGGENILGYDEAVKDPNNIPAFVENIKEVIKSLKEDAKAKHKLTDDAQKEFNDVSAKLAVIKNNNKQIKNYLDAVKALEALNAEDKEIELKKSFIERQNEIDLLKPLFKQLNSLNITIDNCDNQIKAANDKLAEVSKTKKWLADNKDKYIANETLIEELNKIAAILKDACSEKAKLNNEKLQLKTKDSAYSKQFEDYRTKEEEFIRIKNRFFASSAYNLAQLLEDDKPCPVCGSIHHPAKAHNTDPVSEQEYKDAESKYNDLTKQLTNKKTELDNQRTAFQTKEKALIETLTKCGFDYIDSESLYSAELEDRIDKFNAELGKIKEYNKEYSDKEKQSSIDESTNKQALASAEELKKSTSETIKTIGKEIDDKLANNKHIKTREQCVTAMLSKFSVNVENLKKEIEKHNQDKLANQTIINNTPKELVEKGNVDEASLIDEYNMKKQTHQSLSDEENSLNHKISNLEKDVIDINEKYSECETVIHKYTSLNELSKTANGANRMKLSFKMYILADYFDKIIIQANHRLSKITNGRYRLVRRDALGKGNAQQGLDLDVYDVETGKERPASSLSGGEKFVSALSMALGLSDIIETRHALIQVESIFIDEGFGSLDENYLDMAMKALETLKDDNKTVAIISHVEKLKEYIPDGLEVKKAEIGSTVIMKENI